MKTLKVRDSLAVINGDATEYEFPSGGFEIIGPGGRQLFAINLSRYSEGGIEVSASGTIKIGDETMSDLIAVRPRAANVVHVMRLKYE